MHRLLTRFFAACWLFVCISATLAAEPERKTWMVDSTEREGLVYVPEAAKTKETPVVFAFHGHGGSMMNASRVFGIQSQTASGSLIRFPFAS